VPFTVQEIDHIPTDPRRGARNSKCLDVVRTAAAAVTQKVAVTFDAAEEVSPFYKSMMQFIARHPEERANVRKRQDTLYIWITSPGEEYRPGRKGFHLEKPTQSVG
jgi:hypothetical protein